MVRIQDLEVGSAFKVNIPDEHGKSNMYKGVVVKRALNDNKVVVSLTNYYTPVMYLLDDTIVEKYHEPETQDN